MKCIIMDLDGTICNVKHRLHHLERDPKDWVAFHDAMVDDEPIEAIAWFARVAGESNWARNGESHVLIVSARHEDYREHTVSWLQQQRIGYDRLYMRANDDRRPDHEVKEDILQQIVTDGYEPFLVIDDRPEVCEMWRRWGITVLQADYEEHSKFEGQKLLTLLVGPSGSGKSTYARKHYKAGEVVSSDAIREAEGLGHTQDDLALTFKLARGYAKARIDAGLHTVIDATNLKQKDRMAFVRLAPRSTMIEYVMLCRNYDDMISTRGWRPIELIDKHYRTFSRELAKIKQADNLPNVYVSDKREWKQ